MTKHYLRDLEADALQLLKERGQWVIAGVETGIAWPKVPQVVPFGGVDFILRPLTDEDAATVCINTEKAQVTSRDARDLIMRFGSALTWSEGHSFEVTTWMGASHAIRIGRRRGNVIRNFMEPELLPAIPDDDAATALAFYREGISSDNNFYAFLSLYKVLSFIHRDGKQRGAWIEKTLPTLTEANAQNRIQELTNEGINAPEYLRDDGRHAIAHAEKDVFVNPDKLVDHERIYRDLPIMRALARKAIEERFQIYPNLSRDKPEGNEVPGFEHILGPELIAQLMGKDDIDACNVEVPDHVTALIRRGNRIIVFEGMTLTEMKRFEEGCAFKVVNQDDTFFIAVGIDLKNHKLLYEPQGNCGVKLNKKSRSSVALAQKVQEFNWLYYGNGSLELWDADKDELLGVTEPYIPMNMMQDYKAMEKMRAEMQQLLNATSED
jgi:hypothetical protein